MDDLERKVVARYACARLEYISPVESAIGTGPPTKGPFLTISIDSRDVPSIQHVRFVRRVRMIVPIIMDTLSGPSTWIIIFRLWLIIFENKGREEDTRGGPTFFEVIYQLEQNRRTNKLPRDDPFTPSQTQNFYSFIIEERK